MPTRALLDSNVFIFAFERPQSNSRRIVEMLVEGGLLVVVTDRILREVMRYFRRHYDKDLSAKFRDLIILTCDLILEEDIRPDVAFKSLVGRKDAGALAAVRFLGVPHLVSTDSDFANVPEWKTPRAFLELLGSRPSPGDE